MSLGHGSRSCAWQGPGQERHAMVDKSATCGVRAAGELLDTRGKVWRRNVQLINGRARAAQKYPPKLVEGILEAFQRQLVDDGEYSQVLNILEAGPVPDAPPVLDEEEEMY